MKKLINDVDNIILEQFSGLDKSTPGLKMNPSPCYIWHEFAKNQVAIVSGGASGHEPLHVGYVGRGMLTGACPGDIFIRAMPDQIYECSRKINSDKGILFLVKNYKGDIENFKLVVELLYADEVNAGFVLIDDDIAVNDSLYTSGRRGSTGSVLVEKIVGAAAEKGYSLEQCEELGRKVNNNCRTISIATSACIVPAAGHHSFNLSDNEIEFGIGIHGEPGRARIEYTSADEIVRSMFIALNDNTDYCRTLHIWDRASGQWHQTDSITENFEEDRDYIAIVNGLGGTTLSELYIAYNKFHQLCKDVNYRVVRSLVGNYCTALNMEGISITLLKADKEMISLFDAPVDTPALKW